MGASCCSSGEVAKGSRVSSTPDKLPSVRRDSEARRARAAAAVPAEVSGVPSELPPSPPHPSPSAPMTTRTPRASTVHVSLDPGLELLTDTFAVSATTLSQPDGLGEDASSWVDVSLPTHAVHPHMRTTSDVASEGDLASWDPKQDRVRAAHRRERERLMRAEAENRARVEQRAAASRCKLTVRIYKEEFMLQRRTLLRDFFCERLTVFLDACRMQAEVGRAHLEQQETVTWSALLEAHPARGDAVATAAEGSTPPDRFASTNKTLEENLGEDRCPSPCLTTTMENDPLSSSYGEFTSSALRANATESRASTQHVDPRDVLYGKTVARVELAKSPRRSPHSPHHAARSVKET